MPARSDAQQKAAGAALAAKRDKKLVGKLKGSSREMYRSMTEDELETLATKPKSRKLPDRLSPKSD